MTTETPKLDDAEWADCPSGEVGGLVGRLQSRRRRERTRQMAAGVSCFVLLMLAGVYAVPRLGLTEPNFGGITCTEVKHRTGEYIANTLDPQIAARIDAHLVECNHCRIFVNELRARRDREPPLPVQTAQNSRTGGKRSRMLLARVVFD